jgi:hypothetical protein
MPDGQLAHELVGHVGDGGESVDFTHSRMNLAWPASDRLSGVLYDVPWDAAMEAQRLNRPGSGRYSWGVHVRQCIPRRWLEAPEQAADGVVPHLLTRPSELFKYLWTEAEFEEFGFIGHPPKRDVRQSGLL